MKVLDVPGGGTGGDGAVADLCGRFDELISELAELGDRDLFAVASRWEQRLESARLAAVARLAGSDGDSRSIRRRARAYLSRGDHGSGRRSSRSVNRDARRAAALAANRRLAEQAERGEASGDGIDALSKAADETTGEIPADLLDLVSGLAPDQASRVIDEYLEQHAAADDADSKYEAQMEARRVRRYTVPASGSDPALAGIGIEGPDALIDRIWSLVNAGADAAYREAGGRDRPAGEHLPLPQRRFDAALGYFQGAAAGSGGRPSIVITVGIDDLIGTGGRAARQIGSGPISSDLLAEYAEQGDLSVLISGVDGRPLWLGRARRNASAAQFLSLVVRDRGCVLCGAPYQRCQAHHLIPWRAPARGTTDVDNMALLCGSCHRTVHDSRETLYQARSQAGSVVWATRPATESELPPPTPIQRE